MAGARAVGAAGRGWGSSYTGSAGRHSCVCVGTRCSPPGVRGSPVARGVRGRALSPLRLPSSWGLSGPAAHVLSARVCMYGVQRCPRGPYSLCSSGAGSRGFAARVSVVRGVCGQALPFPRLSALWAGCRGLSSILAVGATVRLWGPGAVPSACMPCGGRAPRGWWGLSPRGGPPPLRGASEVRRCPSPGRPPSGRAVRVRHPHAVGARVRVWGPGTVPLACMPCGSCVPRGWWGAAPGGGGLLPLRGASGVRRCPSPSRLPSGRGSRGSATRVPQVRSMRAWGPSTGPTACTLAGQRCSPWGRKMSLISAVNILMKCCRF